MDLVTRALNKVLFFDFKLKQNEIFIINNELSTLLNCKYTYNTIYKGAFLYEYISKNIFNNGYFSTTPFLNCHPSNWSMGVLLLEPTA